MLQNKQPLEKKLKLAFYTFVCFMSLKYYGWIHLQDTRIAVALTH